MKTTLKALVCIIWLPIGIGLLVVLSVLSGASMGEPIGHLPPGWPISTTIFTIILLIAFGPMYWFCAKIDDWYWNKKYNDLSEKERDNEQ